MESAKCDPWLNQTIKLLDRIKIYSLIHTHKHIQEEKKIGKKGRWKDSDLHQPV